MIQNIVCLPDSLKKMSSLTRVSHPVLRALTRIRRRLRTSPLHHLRILTEKPAMGITVQVSLSDWVNPVPKITARELSMSSLSSGCGPHHVDSDTETEDPTADERSPRDLIFFVEQKYFFPHVTLFPPCCGAHEEVRLERAWVSRVQKKESKSRGQRSTPDHHHHHHHPPSITTSNY